MSTNDNRMRRTLARFDRLPLALATRGKSWALGRTIRFVGTAGVHIDEVSVDRVVVSVGNETRVQNHIGTIHAVAMALLAETATGLAIGMHLHDGAVPVIKRMTIDYVRRARGAMSAVAQLTAEQQAALHSGERGEVLVPVTVTDSEGGEPIECQMLWAWTPKRGKPAA